MQPFFNSPLAAFFRLAAMPAAAGLECHTPAVKNELVRVPLLEDEGREPRSVEIRLANGEVIGIRDNEVAM